MGRKKKVVELEEVGKLESKQSKINYNQILKLICIIK